MRRFFLLLLITMAGAQAARAQTVNYRFPDGSSYTGEAPDDKGKHEGSFTNSDGSTYKGQFTHGCPEGTGVYTLTNGTKFEGTFRNGTLIYGTETTPDGYVYTGQFKEFLPHGQGTGKYPSGLTYTGGFSEGDHHGPGVLTHSRGLRIEGTWKENVISGGVIDYSQEKDIDGSPGSYRSQYGYYIRYEGAFNEYFEPEGQGTMTFSTGSRYTGNWVQGKMQGAGSFTFPKGNTVEGLWEDGRFSAYKNAPQIPKMSPGSQKNLFSFNFLQTGGSRKVTIRQDGMVMIQRKDGDTTQERTFPIQSAFLGDGSLWLYSKPITAEFRRDADAEFIGIILTSLLGTLEMDDIPFKNYLRLSHEYNQVHFVDLCNFLKSNAVEVVEKNGKYYINLTTRTMDRPAPSHEGEISYPSGNKYTGGILNDLPSGQGTMVYASGARYEGEWKEGHKHGKGKYTWPSGAYFEGEFQNDFRHYGTTVAPSGETHVGWWEKDSMNGPGTYTWPDGRKFVGSFKADKQHGVGTMTLANGTSYTAEWNEGELVRIIPKE